MSVMAKNLGFVAEAATGDDDVIVAAEAANDDPGDDVEVRTDSYLQIVPGSTGHSTATSGIQVLNDASNTSLTKDGEVSTSGIQVLNDPSSTSLTKDGTKDGEVPEKFTEYLDQFEAVYSFTGHGSRNQISNFDAIKHNLEDLVDDLNKKHGEQEWLAVYGGDHYNPEEPDIGFVMHHLSVTLKVKVLAVQCHEYVKEELRSVQNGEIRASESIEHWDAVIHYETEYDKNDPDKAILFAGHNYKHHCFDALDNILENHLVGASRYIFGKGTCGLFKDKLKGVVSCGGGPIALKETEIALFRELPVLYIRTKVKYTAPGMLPTAKHKKNKDTPEEVSLNVSTKGFGPLDPFMKNEGFQVSKENKEDGTDQVSSATAEEEEEEEEVADVQKIEKPWGWVQIKRSQSDPPQDDNYSKPQYYRQVSDFQESRIAQKVFEKPLGRSEYGFALSIMKLWDIKDNENSFKCSFFLQLVCLGDTEEQRSNPQDPWFEVRNLLDSDVKPPFKEVWKSAKAEHQLKVEEARENKTVPPKLELKQLFEGTFLLTDRDLTMFPYDYQHFVLHFRFGFSAKCKFRPLRPQVGELKLDGMNAVDHWAAAKMTRERTCEEDKGFVGGVRYLNRFVLIPLTEMVGMLPAFLWWMLFCCWPNKFERKLKKQSFEEKRKPYWMETQFTESDPSESATREVYREIKMTLLMRRVSNYVSMNFLLPSLLLGTVGLLMFWIHPVEMAGERLAFIVTLTLAIISLKQSVQSYVPPLARQTFIDKHTMATTVFVAILAFTNILSSRYCLPSCESDLCDKHEDEFINSDFRRKGTNDSATYCECHCDTDNFILYGSVALWFVIQYGFWRAFVQARYRFDKLLHKHGLVCGGAD